MLAAYRLPEQRRCHEPISCAQHELRLRRPECDKSDGVVMDCSPVQRLITEFKAGSPAKENQPQEQQHKGPAQVNKHATASGPSKPVLAPSRRNVQLSSSANRQAAMRQQLEVSVQLSFSWLCAGGCLTNMTSCWETCMLCIDLSTRQRHKC